MRNANKIILTGLMAVTLGSASAQQEVMVSQYMFNGLFLNPAYAGTHPYGDLSLLHRAQWTGINGAPRSSMLAWDSPLLGEKMGVGVSVVHDVIGVTRDLQMDASYSYHLRLGSGHLAFGLKAGVSVYSARLTELTYWDANDEVFASDIKNQLVGKFGFGMYYYDELSYIGLSVPTIYAADEAITADVEGAMAHYFSRHYYLNAGHVFPINEFFDLKPSTLIKFEPNAPFEVDLNLNVLYKERLWFGAGYRTGDAVVGMLEYKVNPMLRVGYSYDLTISELNAYSRGSHEVMLGIDLGRDPIKIKTPRYF